MRKWLVPPIARTCRLTQTCGMGTPPLRAPASSVNGPPDVLLEAAYDLMAAGKRLEAQALHHHDESECLGTSLGVLASTLASLSTTLEHISNRGPGIPSDREIDGVLRVVRRTLDDAARGCDRAHDLASRQHLPPDSPQSERDARLRRPQV